MPVILVFPEHSCGWKVHDQHGSSVPSTTVCRVVQVVGAGDEQSRRRIQLGCQRRDRTG